MDFALCDLRSREVVAVIELDDASHQRASVMKRDDFVNAALKAAGVPCVRVQAKRAYAPDEVRATVLSAIGA